jgi:hypothetical protein
MTFWLAIGPVENWERALGAQAIWGVRERYQTTWNTVKEGDTLIFYGMRPVKGVIGYGTVRSKIRDAKCFWPEEVKQGKVLWPLRLRVDVSFCLPREKWETDKVPLPPLSQGITIQRALQSIREDVARGLLRSFPKVKA